VNLLWKNFINSLKTNKGVFSIGFGDSVGKGISAIFWFLMAGILGPEQYGEVHYFLAIAGMGQIFSLIATSETMTVYTAKKIKIESTLIIISLISGSIAFIIILVTSLRIEVASLVLAFILIELANGILLGNRKYQTYAKFFITQKILLFILGLGLFYQFGISGIIAGVALSHIPYVFVIFKELKKTKIDLSLLIPRKEFIINNYLIVLSGSFSNQIDKFIIVPILGFALLGEYSLALQILVMLTIVNNIIFKYILPQDSIGIKNYKLKRNSIIFSVFIAIFGSILLPFIIPTIFPDYVETVDAIRIISWVVIPDTIILIYTSKLLGLEKSKFVLTSNIISTGILIVGFILLGPIFGILGLAGMVLFSACIQCIILYFGKRNLDKGSVKGEKNVQY
jgi:O-antigen/teichoic acid export membrane protein|tara:strand:- start:73 stop:1260 length:1188 start_codon:yes stop_codon:yes gene_type:complete